MTWASRTLAWALAVIVCGPSVSLFAQSIDSGFIDANGGKLYYESSGEGQPVVLIHGFTLDRRMWDTEFTELSRDFRVIRYDLRGHGKSSGVSVEFSHVDDLAMVISGLSLDTPHLIGLSLGGWIATDFAAVYPEHVRDAVLIDPYYPLPDRDPFDDRIEEHISIGRNGKLEDGLARWLEDPLFEPACEHETLELKLTEIVVAGHGALGDGAAFVNVDKMKRSVRQADKTPSDIRCRVLCLVGKRDLPRFHAVAEYFLQSIPNISVVSVPDAGHMANLENPKVVLQQISGFLRH